MFDDDRPRKKKRRGEDPVLDALAKELARETGDPLFVPSGKRDEEGAAPGVIVAGGVDEAKAYVRGIRPPAGSSGKGASAPANEKRVVVAGADVEAEQRRREALETITTVVQATRDAAKRGLESARKEEAARETVKRRVEGVGKEEAPRETPARAEPAAGPAGGRRRAVLLGGAAALLLAAALSVGIVIGRTSGEELAAPSPAAPALPTLSSVSASTRLKPTSEPDPAVTAMPASAPAEPPASASSSAVVPPTAATSAARSPTAAKPPSAVGAPRLARKDAHDASGNAALGPKTEPSPASSVAPSAPPAPDVGRSQPEF